MRRVRVHYHYEMRITDADGTMFRLSLGEHEGEPHMTGQPADADAAALLATADKVGELVVLLEEAFARKIPHRVTVTPTDYAQGEPYVDVTGTVETYPGEVTMSHLVTIPWALRPTELGILSALGFTDETGGSITSITRV